MFQLSYRTGPDWYGRVAPHLDQILVEQAHLERKAAAMAMTLLFRYQQHACLQVPLSEVAREELEHFEQVIGWLDRRGVAFGPQVASGYAARLMEVVRPTEPDRLLDTLLCCAVIEARSCERLKLLGAGLRADGVELGLADFYEDLVRSEARHHGLYVGLAKQLFDPELVEGRLVEVCAHEGQVQEQQPNSARLHT